MKIHEYATAGNVVALQGELAASVSVETRDKGGQTPLMAAVASSRAGVEIVNLLVSSGANVNALSLPTREESAPQSVLAIAAKAASCEKIKLLIAAGADVKFVDFHGSSILLHALYGSYSLPVSERLALLSFLVEAGASRGRVFQLR